MQVSFHLASIPVNHTNIVRLMASFAVGVVFALGPMAAARLLPAEPA